MPSYTAGSVMRPAGRIAATPDACEGLVAVSGETSHVLVEDGGEVVGLLSENDYSHAPTVQREFRAGTT